MVSFRFIHVMVYVQNSFLSKLNNCPLYVSVCTTLCLSIHVSVEHVGCLLALALVNSAAVDMGIQIPLWGPAFNSSGYIPRSGITHMVILFLIFEKLPSCFQQLGCVMLPSYQQCTRTPISSHPHQHLLFFWVCLCVYFDSSHTNDYEVGRVCVFT